MTDPFVQVTPPAAPRALVIFAGALAVTCLSPTSCGDLAAPQARTNAALRGTPGTQVLVVTANLQEAFGRHDLRRLREIEVFVERLLPRIPYGPDVLLLQEVRHKSARKVARQLSAQTGISYGVAMDPGGNPWRETSRRVIRRDTAIVINRHTMVEAQGGFVPTSYAGRHGRPGTKEPQKLQVKQNAHALVRKRGTGVRLAVVSVHWPGRRMATRRLGNLYGVRWSRKIAEFLARRYPRTDQDNAARVIAGDFNRKSHAKQPSERRRPKPFWRVLTHEPHDYRDAVWMVDARPGNKDIVNGGVDYIFARARVSRAGVDSAYDRRKALGNPRKYYADHRFRWALITP